MGEAKRRGNFNQRKAEAIKNKKDSFFRINKTSRKKLSGFSRMILKR